MCKTTILRLQEMQRWSHTPNTFNMRSTLSYRRTSASPDSPGPQNSWSKLCHEQMFLCALFAQFLVRSNLHLRVFCKRRNEILQIDRRRKGHLAELPAEVLRRLRRVHLAGRQVSMCFVLSCPGSTIAAAKFVGATASCEERKNNLKHEKLLM